VGENAANWAAAASAGMAVVAGSDITRQVAELRDHLASICSVLRIGDSMVRMRMHDTTVEMLRDELDIAVPKTKHSLLKGSEERNSLLSFLAASDSTDENQD
jgi:hypothetical protein